MKRHVKGISFCLKCAANRKEVGKRVSLTTTGVCVCVWGGGIIRRNRICFAQLHVSFYNIPARGIRNGGDDIYMKKGR
jgi:hypothetical protein